MTPPFRWDRTAGLYRDVAGRIVSPSVVRRYLDEALASAGKRMEALADQLRSGSIDVITWEVRMRREVKVVSTYSGAAAKGGWQQMTDADLGRVGRYVQDQYRYLRGFAQDIVAGRQPLNGRLNARSRLYAEAGRPLYHRMENAEQKVRGMAERQSIRHGTDSCAGCIEAEAAGWVPIDGGGVTEIGERECATRCKCEWAYR